MSYPYAKIELVIERKPAPPPLDPFECLACQQMIERDPYSPDFQAPPVCWRCQWNGGRTQLSHVPVSMWGQFRVAQVLLNLIATEATNARRC